MHTLYYDMWNEWSNIELRGNKSHKAYDIGAYKTYPTIKVIPELKRNGFDGDLHNSLRKSCSLPFLPTAERKH